MKREELCRAAFPPCPDVFDQAVDTALANIRASAAQASVSGANPFGARRTRRAVVWALAALLALLCALGIAEGIRRGVFQIMQDTVRDTPILPEASELVRRDAAFLRLNETDIAVTEVAFDGATVRLVMSVLWRGADAPLREEDIRDPQSAFGKALARDGVTALGSFDWFTLDGTEYGMTGGSGGSEVVGAENGEVLIYFELRLSSDEGVEMPEGAFTLGLPVRRAETRDARQLYIPIEAAALPSIRDAAPAAPVPMGAGTITVTEARLSPIQWTVTFRLDLPDTVPVAEAADCVAAWSDFAFVDADGALVCPEGGLVYGWGVPQGETDGARHLLMMGEFPPAAEMPDALWLAPVGFYRADGDWGGDMTMAVALNMGGEAE